MPLNLSYMALITSGALLFICSYTPQPIASAQLIDENFYEGPDVTAAQILTARGFIADEFYFVSDGYRLRMTRGRNPLFEKGFLSEKEPILFVPGVFTSTNHYLINSFGARPKDLSRINLKNSTLAEILSALKNETSANALGALAINFGHEIFLWDRRGSLGSRELVNERAAAAGPTTLRLDSLPLWDQEGRGPVPIARDASPPSNGLNPLTSFLGTFSNVGAFLSQVPLNLNGKFWNYSLDEQASVDFCRAVDFVLEKTGRKKVALVTWSTGGAISLMAQSLYPNELAPKLSSQINWAPAYSVGNDNPLASVAITTLKPLLETYVGPLIPTFSSPAIQASLGLLCSNPLARSTVCAGLVALLYGTGGDQEPLYPQLTSSLFFPSSTHELAQFAQVLEYSPKSMHKFNYRGARNVRAYNSTTPPAYDLARIRAPPNSISIYAGPTDGLVTLADIEATRSQLKVAHKFHQIGIPFSHIGYWINKQTSERVIIPSMREIETLATATA